MSCSEVRAITNEISEYKIDSLWIRMVPAMHSLSNQVEVWS